MAVTLLGAVALIAASWTIMWRAARWHSPQPPAPLVINVANLTDPEAFSRGRELFLGTCSACHGPDLAGMPNSGKPLRTSEFVRSQSDEQMLAFVKSGRPSWDPANTTGVDMPPRGGNPTLNDDNLKDIIAFLRGVQSAVKN
jgi:disulfide bond formation protein DsbB